jgi:hypothetical protein
MCCKGPMCDLVQVANNLNDLQLIGQFLHIEDLHHYSFHIQLPLLIQLGAALLKRRFLSVYKA